MFFINYSISAQLEASIVGTDAFARGRLVELGINNQGVFGARRSNRPAGFHDNRDSDPHDLYGFIANPLDNGWAEYDGDFFTPGAPEEGFSIEISGQIFSNNNFGAESQIPGSIIDAHVVTSTCSDDYAQIIWEGNIGGLNIKRFYSVSESKLFIQMNTIITNVSSTTATNVYWMHNLDPDNNQTINGDFNTTNTIISQATTDPNYISIVTANQADLGGADTDGSSVSFFSKEPFAHVTYGGFDNNTPSGVYNGFGYTDFVGASSNGDDAISIAFSLGDIASGESKSFVYYYFTQVIDTTVDAGVASIIGINPISCAYDATGHINFGGLLPNTTYDVSYDYDTNPVAPLSYTTDVYGSFFIDNLFMGTYNNFSIGSPTCTSLYSITVELSSIGDLTMSNLGDNLQLCSDTNSANFDLTQNDTIIIGGQMGVNIKYYTNLIAGVPTNEITNPSNYINTSNPQTIYALIVNETTQCSDLSTFQIEVIPLPTPLVSSAIPTIYSCNNDGSGSGTFQEGFAIFDLTSQTIAVLAPDTSPGLIIHYYFSEEDAIDDVNSVDDPAYFYNTIAYGQKIYVRVEKNISDCYVLREFDIIIPRLELSIDYNHAFCINNDGSVILGADPTIITANLTSNLIDPISYEWYYNGVVMVGETNSNVTELERVIIQ